jgi:hypothetical protein
MGSQEFPRSPPIGFLPGQAARRGGCIVKLAMRGAEEEVLRICGWLSGSTSAGGLRSRMG